MMKFCLLGLPLLVLTGCRKSDEPVQSEGQYGDQQGEWQPVPQEEQPIEETPGLEGVPEARAPMGTTEAMGQLRDATERLRAGEDTDHSTITNALRSLADAVAGLQGVDDPEQYRTTILTYADKIQTSDPASMEHAEWTKSALKETVNVLQNVGQDRQIVGFDERIDMIQDQLGTIEGGQPLGGQQALVANVFEQITEVIVTLQQPTPTGTF